MPQIANLTNKQKRWLRQQAHHLKPLVLLGRQGLTDAVLAEISLALDHHELIKVRVNGGDHNERDAEVGTIAERANAALVQRIGNIAVYFRANPKRSDGILLPD
ncbi:MAG: ribosome assembly RNA-binding protein YhbY [Thiohalocapsa sp.]